MHSASGGGGGGGSATNSSYQNGSPLEDSKYLVKAVYKFKGTNNDELNFEVNDVITVTQREDGGWWEGTLDGKTGWFPSNYVTRIEVAETAASNTITTDIPRDVLRRQIDYRQQVIKELIARENEFLKDTNELLKKYLNQLRHRLDILKESEYRQLVGNLEELIKVHQSFKEDVESASKSKPREQKLGKVFLEHGAIIKNAHWAYWSNHPKAVCILETHREALDSFMEGLGASKPGLIALTTSLSKPFRHLEKFSGICQELEQHLEDDHPDRGDTQRSIGYFKNAAADCAKIRRQKELELEVLTGTIRGWEGDDINNLGDVIFMSSVAVGPENKDRYFVLFHSYLLILSVSTRMSAFIYEGKLPLSGISVNRLEDVDTVRNSFEITGPMIERILVMCQTKSESLKWVDVLRSQIKTSRTPSMHPTPPPHKSLTPSLSMSPAPMRRSNMNSKKNLWKMSCLRPAPPTRSYVTPDGRRKTVKNRETTYDEDMQILRVIEAYCTSGKQRQTFAGSAFLENLPVLLSEEKNNRVNDRRKSSGNNAVEEKGFLDAFESLKDTVMTLKEQNRILTKKIDDESIARKKMENLLKSTIFQNRNDINWD